MTQNPNQSKIPRGDGLFWGVVLIAVGVFWLFGNFGWFSWDWLATLWQLWPLILIVLGLNYLLRDNPLRLPVIAGVAVLGAVALIGWNARPGAAGSELQISIPLQGTPRAEINLRTGVTKLELTSGGSAELLVSGTARLLPGERLEPSTRTEGDLSVVNLRSEGNVSGGNFRGNRGWELALSPVPLLSINLESGVGESELNLSGLRLERLQVQSGVGSLRVELPAQGSYSANLQGGVGQIRVDLPDSLEARIQVSRGLGGLELPSGLTRIDDNTYQTPGYNTAPNRVDLRVSGGVGQVEIRR